MAYAGIVLISHSSKIAEGIKDLITQVVKEVPIEAAGGTEEDDIGTSIDKIQEAIGRADTGKGVLLFYDIGSAKMNAEMAMEMADSENIQLVEAPLVEGSYTAAVESGMGKSVQEVHDAVVKSF
ncbi:PTS-dependent dihydroxyacetone kinase phosphotransferase subunit DhaM [Virgibacillus sp. NKC19-16]|uniref:dihydroxyacetone kinase phosphoryl donor subunit DhaM n=1 Tax=Virgibacillus salidurans TaxID=2831673 RepID=UPI001F2F620C|nr:dihydroxyacetone kinase phosphoryl donor subunit DhaM [Virgibacillus sp. NKC19-16]UJL45444.1 PTS-dependent dihydroxyacetone kinase phosphotransferase subunit DhaM [Virgibacillus sp. NKC19-16]